MEVLEVILFVSVTFRLEPELARADGYDGGDGEMGRTSQADSVAP